METICNKLCSINTTLSTIAKEIGSMDIEAITCALTEINHTVSGLGDSVQMVYASLASVNPMAVAAEYPDEQEDKVVYSTIKVRFLDMLNPDMVVLFKGTFSVNKPVYFKDTSNYEHIVCIGDTSHQATANELINNLPYPAKYEGNYIILNPTSILTTTRKK